MLLYRCDVCKQVHAEKSVPESWRTIVIGDEDDSENKWLACTACVSSFHAWLRRQLEPPKPSTDFGGISLESNKPKPQKHRHNNQAD